MRKVFASLLLAVITMVGSVNISGATAEKAVDITTVSVKDGLVSVEVINHGEQTRLTLTANKISPAEENEMKNLYAVLQKDAKKDETITYLFLIPDTKDEDIPGTGTYQLWVKNTESEGDVYEFEYADSNTITDFVEELKKADLSVTDDSLAYEALSSVIEKPEYEGVYFSIGMDYDLYASKSEAVQRDTLKVLHNDGIQKLDKNTIPDAFSAAFGVAAFNNGEKEESIRILSPTYNGKKIEEALTEKAIDLMNSSYDSGLEFAKGFNVAYGLVTINLANINNMDDKLSEFKEATDLCVSEIDKILDLGESASYKAFEYMIKSIDKSSLKNEEELADILDKAYKEAKKNGGSSSGSNGGSRGNGGDGSYSNSTLAETGRVTATVGSGTAEEKVSAGTVGGFTDLMADHWAAESILYLKDNGVVSGTDTGAFEADRSITREEFTKMVMIAFDFEASDNPVQFKDAVIGKWYTPYIAAAVETGIIKGIGDNEFGIGQSITRQDMAVIIERILAVKGTALEQKKIYSGFADEEEIADYAKDSVKALFEIGVINGKDNNRFAPAESSTRAEASKIIYEAIKGGM